VYKLFFYKINIFAESTFLRIPCTLSWR